MDLIDISVGISPDLPVWPGDPPIEMNRLSSIAEGANSNVTRLAAGVHVGTHVDAPRHFIDGGAGVEQLPLEPLIGEALVVALPEVEIIDGESLAAAGIPADVQRLLFKTRNSEIWQKEGAGFQKDYVAIEESGARWLVERGIQLVGVDYLSVAPWGDSVPTHRRLLQAEVVIVEGLNLSGVAPGRYQLYCLPIKLVGSDGAPARALLSHPR